MSTLTRRQKEFIGHYVICKVATKAAILAGYSPKHAGEQGCLLLKKPEIKEEIAKRFNEIDRKLDITPQEIVDSLIKEAKSAEKCSDRLRALELLSKIKKMYNDNEVNVGVMNLVHDKLNEIAEKRLNTTNSISTPISPIPLNQTKPIEIAEITPIPTVTPISTTKEVL